MSLLERVERAQRGTDSANAAVVPVAPPTPPTRAQVAGREELMRTVRAHLQTEVINAFDTLLDVSTTDVHEKIEGIVDRTMDLHGFVVTRDERLRLIEEVANDVTGFG
ncbi:MAG TPA: hypothetical protein VIM39_11485, partial [Candidatus Limnocylindrales bacterium]